MINQHITRDQRDRATSGGIRVKLEHPENPADQPAAEGQANQGKANANIQIAEAEADNINQDIEIAALSGSKGLDALIFAETINGTIPQFGWTQEQAAQAATTRGGSETTEYRKCGDFHGSM